ncbi:hypothetical protein GCM10010123_13690 [Pilimelia anulata]|uniref:Lipoprotein n=1 Tax=Pilimelia anulata TaxID=53371 RepID=A0A8J3B864_9ACTN|nr:hypothetical protein [Pilimelia anulata]GGJ85257.1 hypothetical protein GCM10010123_13690 [Pilimelia anulata]
MLKGPLTALTAALLTLGAAGCCTRNRAAAAAPGPGVPAGVAAEHAALAGEVAAAGGETTVGDWRVAYVVEKPRGWFTVAGGTHTLRKPAAGETHHLTVVPIEAATGRIVPDVPVTLQVLDAAGRPVDQRRLWFLRDSYYHYAHNFAVPRAGVYTLRATLGTPAFARYGADGDTPALSRGTVALFPGVRLNP